LAAVLNAKAGLQVVAKAENGSEAIELFRKHHPDITLMDLFMPGLTGVEATAAICREFPNARIIILTVFDGDEDIHRALRAGARGYVLKKMLGPVLVEAIRTVHAGERYLPAIATRRLAERSAGEPLTIREEEVLELVVKGLSNKELADVLKITEQTAKVHLKNILRKLDVSDRTEAATSAILRGIVHLG
jgi:two-component system NarL family response regulator